MGKTVLCTEREMEGGERKNAISNGVGVGEKLHIHGRLTSRRGCCKPDFNQCTILKNI